MYSPQFVVRRKKERECVCARACLCVQHAFARIHVSLCCERSVSPPEASSETSCFVLARIRFRIQFSRRLVPLTFNCNIYIFIYL
jgi:hypothetical protein